MFVATLCISNELFSDPCLWILKYNVACQHCLILFMKMKFGGTFINYVRKKWQHCIKVISNLNIYLYSILKYFDNRAQLWLVWYKTMTSSTVKRPKYLNMISFFAHTWQHLKISGNTDNFEIICGRIDLFCA